MVVQFPDSQLQVFTFMTRSNPSDICEPDYGRTAPDAYLPAPSSTGSAVSWAAIFAGAATAAALLLILLILGTGLGLSSVSPWEQHGVSAATFGVSTIILITFALFSASGMGEYLAGRLRTKWISVHTNEVHFRDTAHGFMAWAVATLVVAEFLISSIVAIVSGGVQAGAAVAGGAAAMAGLAGSDSIDGDGNFFDSLFRKDVSAPAGATGITAALTVMGTPGTSDAGNTAASSAEVVRIFVQVVVSGALPPEDVRCVGQLVTQRTGLSQQDAEKRVTNTHARAQAKLNDVRTATKDSEDKARKASSYATLWPFVLRLIGAFVTSLAATLGGCQRDF